MAWYPRLVKRLLPGVEFHQNRYARGLSQVLAPGIRWLDLGAGERLHHGWIGPRPRELAGMAKSVIGCDLEAPHMRRNACLSGACVANGEALPFADQTFDLVTANMVLEHLPSPVPVFREVARVLRDGGRFVFLTPNRGHPVVWVASLLIGTAARRRLAVRMEHRAAEHVFPTFYRANTRGDLRTISAAVGLRIEQLETFSSYPFVRVFPPLTALECLWIRASTRPALAGFRSNVFGSLRRDHAKG
jgi:SAM-dependent methyltransferase